MRRRVLFLALLVAGCGSAEGAYVDGMDLEVAGDYYGASEAYALALERDPEIPNVAGRLVVAGREAVARLLAEAASGGPEEAANAYLRADALVIRSSGVGVDLERPATFASDRDASLSAAVEHLRQRGDALFSAGDYEDTIDVLGRARAFRPTIRQASALDQLALDAYGEWAEDDVADGQFRSALARTDAMLALGMADRDADIADLRAEILTLGTVVVAVLPVEGEGDELFLRDLGDIIVEEHMAPPPLFVGVLDPADVRRWERRERDARDPDLSDSPRRIGDAADDLGVDLASVAALFPIAEQTTRGTARAATAEIRGSRTRATYTVRETRIELEGEADVLVVDAGASIARCDDRVRRSIREEADVATYDGDWQELSLSRSDRRMFADDVLDRARERAEERLLDAMAAAIADRVASCAGRMVR
ncbi:MAG: hypothetical protein AAGK21_08520 [Bacteroidota bacterium]